MSFATKSQPHAWLCLAFLSVVILKKKNIKTSFSIVRFLYLVLVQSSGVLTIFNLAFNGKELDCVVHFFVSGISLRLSGERDRRKN